MSLAERPERLEEAVSEGMIEGETCPAVQVTMVEFDGMQAYLVEYARQDDGDYRPGV